MYSHQIKEHSSRSKVEESIFMNNFPIVDSWRNHNNVELKIDKDKRNNVQLSMLNCLI